MYLLYLSLDMIHREVVKPRNESRKSNSRDSAFTAVNLCFMNRLFFYLCIYLFSPFPNKQMSEVSEAGYVSRVHILIQPALVSARRESERKAVMGKVTLRMGT